ncbi:type 1 periplasmic binding fold superfamily protein [Winogradskyella maritima]|uniref:Type 1 periplasmic binding fold superfamily protein n=1 Tax=Winogradskyella maritima TaxID=1517766 RepID=A0ABV8AIL5_9FLAO|nr:type 1 periplasmic binding fold superfamily protein [Winogradskyella maritima]
MKTIKNLTNAFFALILVATFTSCSDDDNPAPVNPEELITNVVLTFTNDADAMDTVTLTSIAPDGQDGTSTETISGSFTSGATYSLSLAITNTSETPADDVLNDDIIPEADEHFFAYAVNSINLTMTRDANDVDGPESSKLGVNTTWVAGAASTGNVQIRLIHEPTSVDDSDGFGTATGGSEDINIVFNGVAIQ